jgi:hypothetical protein
MVEYECERRSVSVSGAGCECGWLSVKKYECGRRGVSVSMWSECDSVVLGDSSDVGYSSRM